jgi:hypothetical protein
MSLPRSLDDALTERGALVVYSALGDEQGDLVPLFPSVFYH